MLKTGQLTVSLMWALSLAMFFVSIDQSRGARLRAHPNYFERFQLPSLFKALMGPIRRKRMNSEAMAQWPTLLESVAIAVIAGMDLHEAFEVCAMKTHGRLRLEFDKVLIRIRSGQPLPAALAAMEKEGIEPARRLRTTLAQAETLGTPIGEVLSALSDEYRDLEKQQFESRLNSLPVKLSIITVVFLLPPVLILSIMPHVIIFIGSGW